VCSGRILKAHQKIGRSNNLPVCRYRTREDLLTAAERCALIPEAVVQNRGKQQRTSVSCLVFEHCTDNLQGFRGVSARECRCKYMEHIRDWLIPL
jgi:hypothetical protein